MSWFNAHRDNDAAMETEALRVLTDIVPDYSVSVPGFPADHVDPQQVERLRTLAQQASLGDTPSVQQYMDTACQGLIQAGAV